MVRPTSGFKRKVVQALLLCTFLGYTSTAFVFGVGLGVGVTWLLSQIGHVPTERAVLIFLASVSVCTLMGIWLAWDIVRIQWRSAMRKLEE